MRASGSTGWTGSIVARVNVMKGKGGRRNRLPPFTLVSIGMSPLLGGLKTRGERQQVSGEPDASGAGCGCLDDVMPPAITIKATCRIGLIDHRRCHVDIETSSGEFAGDRPLHFTPARHHLDGANHLRHAGSSLLTTGGYTAKAAFSRDRFCCPRQDEIFTCSS